jgi:hypothetical protein
VDPIPDIETALAQLSAGGDQQEFLQALATSEVVLPQAQEPTEDGAVQLPVFEQEGTQYVAAFTSADRMAQSGLDAPTAVNVPAAALAQSWPQDEELWFTLNPGAEEASVVLAPDAVRSLATVR